MRKIPTVFNKEQLLQVFKSIDDPRLMMACLLGLFCGLRNGEVCRLRVQDIDLSTKRIRIANSKNPNRSREGYGKDRVVAIPQCFTGNLKNYLNLLGPDAYYLFPTTNLINDHMKTNDLARRFFLVLERTGLLVVQKLDALGRKKYAYRFHTLRHTFATIIWEKTGDILAVKHALGHSKLETTLIYTHVTNKVVEAKINEAFGGQNEISVSVQDPLGVLMRRLANGEIDVSTFQQLRNALREKPSTVYIG